jgi:hypothetical protein
MPNTVIVQFYLGEDKALTNKILYPELHEIGEIKLAFHRTTLDLINGFFKLPGCKERSLLIDAILRKNRKGNWLHYGSLLHKLSTNVVAGIEVMQHAESEELSITVWENDQRAKFLGYLKTASEYDRIDISTSEVRGATGIRVARVQSVNLRRDNQKLTLKL